MQSTTLQRPLVWLRRYLPSELLGVTAMLLCAWLATGLGANPAATALAATWAENTAYYGLMLFRDLRAGPRARSGAILATLRNTLLEFGPAELLDSLLIRPALLYAGIMLAPHLALGVTIGKLAADCCFYLLTISCFELLQRHTRRADAVSTVSVVE